MLCLQMTLVLLCAMLKSTFVCIAVVVRGILTHGSCVLIFFSFISFLFLFCFVFIFVFVLAGWGGVGGGRRLGSDMVMGRTTVNSRTKLLSSMERLTLSATESKPSFHTCTFYGC